MNEKVSSTDMDIEMSSSDCEESGGLVSAKSKGSVEPGLVTRPYEETESMLNKDSRLCFRREAVAGG
jgi:hypothetical protein